PERRSRNARDDRLLDLAHLLMAAEDAGERLPGGLGIGDVAPELGVVVERGFTRTVELAVRPGQDDHAQRVVAAELAEDLAEVHVRVARPPFEPRRRRDRHRRDGAVDAHAAGAVVLAYSHCSSSFVQGLRPSAIIRVRAGWSTRRTSSSPDSVMPP